MTDTGPPAAPRSRPLKGVLLVVLATLGFAMTDALTKLLTVSHPVPVVIAVRYLATLGLLSLVLGPRVGTRLWRTDRPWLVMLRGLFLALAVLSMGLALRRMPVGEAVAIGYLAPFLVMLLAIPLLGERIAATGWICAATGFLGVLLIARPGGGLDPTGVAYAFANAGCSAAYHLLTRHLSKSESTIALLYHSALVGSVVFCALAAGSIGEIALGAGDLAMMGLLGVIATLGHYFFTAAYREAPASLLAPVNYLHLFWAGGFGWLLFAHVPDRWSLAGIALVCASGAVIAIRARGANRGR
ncbi:MAG: DMT family transporter [Alphaproteobacteria bacterium]|nr:DMT family transporter [Alphaproteobacteria bacterium]